MKIPKILSIFIGLAFLVSGSVFGATIKVPDDYATIQEAIDAAVDGVTVLVASGTYPGYIYFNGKKITVRSESGPNVTTIDGRVDFYGNETEESLLEGFTTWGSDIQASSPTIKNCKLKGEGTASTGGHGSIYSGSSPTFIDCQIYDGQAGVGGGYDVRDSSATFIDCDFFENEASSNGGALYINNSSVTLENCSFSQNSARDEWGGGGAIFVTGVSILNINDCEFSKNSAAAGGAILNGYEDTIVIVNSNFEKNSAHKWGGAIFTNASASFTIENCIFTENNANWHGGAIHINWESSPTITNSIFYQNKAGSGGGGGAIWIQPGCFPYITNCTFSRNSAEWKGGAILIGTDSIPTITNCIFWEDNAPQGPEIIKSHDDVPDPEVNYCDIQGGYPGTGNINADPLFVDPVNGDLHIQPGSPCIDKGSSEGAPNVDFEGDIRPWGAGFDMGADEFVPGYIEVTLDIKPGSYPNSINLKSRGKVPVAILTTDDFDADNVDPDTCLFAGASPVRWNIEDVDRDGDDDMILHFKTQELDLTKHSTEATLEGETIEGTPIIGTDSVNIVPKGNMHSKKAKKKKKK